MDRHPGRGRVRQDRRRVVVQPRLADDGASALDQELGLLPVVPPHRQHGALGERVDASNRRPGVFRHLNGVGQNGIRPLRGPGPQVGHPEDEQRRRP